MGSQQPRSAHPRSQQHTRDDVLRVAEELFTAEGPHGLSVRRIAEALGVSRQIVYSRFQGKPDLVRALHAEGFRRLAERQAAVRGEPGTDEHVRGLGHAYRDAALASPALFDLMFGRPIADFEPDESARAVAMGTFTPVVAAARAWLEARGGPVSDEASLRLARSFWAVTHGVVTLETAGLLSSDVAPAMLDDLLTSVLAAEETARRNTPVT
jgi:AcrR family transcriptional regulator